MNDTYRLLKEISLKVKYSVVITDMILTIYVLWLIATDTAHWLPGMLFGYTPVGAYLLLRANKLFHLCLTHKLMIIHSFVVYLCCVYQAYYRFGIMLYPMRWLMFISGLYLILQLIKERSRNKS